MAQADGEIIISTLIETRDAAKDLKTLFGEIRQGADKISGQLEKISNSLDSFLKSFNQYAKESAQQMKAFSGNAQTMRKEAEKTAQVERKQAAQRKADTAQDEAQQKRRAAGREAVRREQERLLAEEQKAAAEEQKRQQYESSALANAKKAAEQNTGKRITNQTPQEIQQEIDSLTKYGNAAKNANEMAFELAKAKHEVSSLEEQGKWFGDEEYDKAHQNLTRIKADIKEYQKTLEVAPKPENPFGLDTIEGKLKEAQIELSRLLNSGKGIEAPEVQAAVKNVAELTEQYKNMYKEASKTEAQKQKEADKAAAQAEREAAAKERAEAAAQRQAEREAARAQKLSEIAAKENAELIHAENLKMISETADVADQHVIELNKELQDLEARQKLLKEAGVGNMGFSEFAENADRIRGIKEELKGVNREAQPTSGVFDRIKQKISEAAQNMLKFGNASRHSNSSVGVGFGKLIKTVLRYGFAIRSTYILVNKLKAFTKEGLKNMALYSNTTNSAISSMLTALNTLKNSLGAAFAPIVETVAPYITSLINMIASAVTAVNQFISALLGRSTYTKAIAVQQDYAKSLGGTAAAADKAASGSDKAGKAAKKAAKEQEKFLAGFDEIEKIPDQSDSSSGSGSGGGGGGGSGGSGGGGTGQALQFVTESIPGIVNNWADMLRDAWEKADFTEIGGIIGAKLRDALDSIPWDTIKDTAKRVAKSLATLLNGFFETEGLSQSIGHTIAEAFNTGFEFVNTFLENFHFDSFGKFISSGIQAAFNRFDWGEVTRALSNVLKGAFDFGAGFLQGIDWKALPGDIAEAIVEAVRGFDFKGAFKSAGKLIGAALTASIDLISGIADLVVGFLSGIAKYFKEHIDEAKKSGGTVADGIFQGIKDAFGGVAKWVEDNIVKPFSEGFSKAFDVDKFVKNLQSQVEGTLRWLKDFKINLDPTSDDFGISESHPREYYVKLVAKELEDKVPADKKKIDNAQANVDRIEAKDGKLNVQAETQSVNWAPNSQKDLTGIRGKADSVNWAPNSQKDLNVNAKTKDVDVKDKDVNVDANSKDVDVKNKGVSVKATSKKTTLKNNNVSVKATADKLTLKNNTIKVNLQYKKHNDQLKAHYSASGGILQHGVWHNIPQYAGGSLNAGSMFVAGERGPEVVGHIGGRTEVLNKSQIASAIYQAMVSAMAKMSGYFSRMTSVLANIPPAIQTMGMTQHDFVLEVPQMATGTVLPPQATISTQDATMLREAIVGLTAALQSAQVSGQHGTTQNNITLELPGLGVLGRAMVKYIEGEAKQGRYPLSGYM